MFRVWVPCKRCDRFTALLKKDKGAWLGPATVLAQEKGRSQEQHEEAIWHSLDRGARSTHAVRT